MSAIAALVLVARAAVESIVVVTAPSGGVVLVDGVSVGRSADAPLEVPVAAGTHDVEVTLDGSTARARIFVEEGERLPLKLTPEANRSDEHGAHLALFAHFQTELAPLPRFRGEGRMPGDPQPVDPFTSEVFVFGPGVGIGMTVVLGRVVALRTRGIVSYQTGHITVVPLDIVQDVLFRAGAFTFAVGLSMGPRVSIVAPEYRSPHDPDEKRFGFRAGPLLSIGGRFGGRREHALELSGSVGGLLSSDAGVVSILASVMYGYTF